LPARVLRGRLERLDRGPKLLEVAIGPDVQQRARRDRQHTQVAAGRGDNSGDRQQMVQHDHDREHCAETDGWQKLPLVHRLRSAAPAAWLRRGGMPGWRGSFEPTLQAACNPPCCS
jgi:hypothetical protein